MYLLMLLVLFLPQSNFVVTSENNNIEVKIDFDSRCNDSSFRCLTLSQCFLDIAGCFLTNTSLHFQPGTYSTGALTGMSNVSNIANLRFHGSNTTIKCRNEVGFLFYQIDGLQIYDLKFSNCGVVVDTNSVRECTFWADVLPSQDPRAFLRTSVAVMIVHSYNVNISHVSIRNSTGYGFFAVNLLGRSSISNSVVAYSNFGAIGQYQDNFDSCKNPDNVGCSGGNMVVLYEDCKFCLSGIHQLDISTVVVKHGVNLLYWETFSNIEAAGGLSISTQQLAYTVDIVVRDSIFDSNTGHNAGNAVVYVLASNNSYIEFLNTTIFNGNSDVKFYADLSITGGVHCFWAVQGNSYEIAPISSDRHLLINNCTFANNSGVYGGALYIESTIDTEIEFQVKSVVHLYNSDFIDNYGYASIIRAEEIQTEEIKQISNFLSLIINDTRIRANKPHKLTFNSRFDGELSNSTLYVNRMIDLKLVDIRIVENSMRGFHASKTGSVSWFGVNTISNNIADNGGGLKLYSSTLIIQPSSFLFILNNTAEDRGGGIFVKSFEDRILSCFFVADYSRNVTQPQIILRGNEANVSGNSIFGGHIDRCYLESTRFRNGYAAFNALFDIPFNHSLTEVTSTIQRLCFCKKEKPDCGRTVLSLSTFPGQTFSFPAVAVGQLNGSTPGTAVSHIINSSAPVTLGIQQEAQQLLTVCNQLNFTLSSREKELVTIGVQTSYDKSHLPNSIVLMIEVYTAPCPVGFTLDLNTKSCDCNFFLRGFNLKCSINNQQFQRPFPVWIGYNRDRNLILAHPSCPLGYCKQGVINFTLNDTDSLCQDGHSGILCGGCSKNLSAVFGTSSCKKCSNQYLALLVFFLVAGLMLVLVMIYGDFTISKGTFNALIFYANIVRINNSSFFPIGHTNPITIFIAWLNLDLGIETCFYDGMDVYARTWLQYAFPAYIILLVLVVIVFGKYSSYTTKIFGDNAIQVLATLLLLSYTKIQRVIIETWSSTFIRYENGSFTVWLFDGNVAFMNGKHIVLCVAAILAFIGFIVPFVLILLCEYPLQSKFATQMLRYRLTPLIHAYQGPYKTHFRWWTGSMLLIRSILLLVFILNILGDRRLNLEIVFSVCVLLLGVMWNAGTIYKEKYVNVIESFYIVNLGLLSGWTAYNRQDLANYHTDQRIVTYVLIGSAFLVFVCITACNFYSNIRDKCLSRKRDEENIQPTHKNSESVSKVICAKDESNNMREILLETS